MDFGPPRKSPGYLAYEPAALGCPASGSFQYSRTANFRAMASGLARRNFNLSGDFHFGILTTFQCNSNRFRQGCFFMLSIPSGSGGSGKGRLYLLRVQRNPEVRPWFAFAAVPIRLEQ